RLCVLLDRFSAELPAVGELLDASVFAERQRATFGRVTERSAGMIRHRHQCRTRKVERKAAPPTRSAAFGEPGLAHRFLLDFQWEAPPVGAWGNESQVSLLSRAKIHDDRVYFIKLADGVSQRGPRKQSRFIRE